METEIIVVSEYCQKSHIDPSFIFLLEDGGLIDVQVVDGQPAFFVSQLREVEMYTRMYYELSINVEGIEAIHHLLARVRNLQDEIRSLQRELRAFRSAVE